MKDAEELLDLCGRPTDYSQDFVDRVESVARALAPCLAPPPRHDASMDYGASQSLSYWFDAGFNGVAWAAPAGVYRLDFLFSSKADLYTVVSYSLAETMRPPTWVPDAAVLTTGPLADWTRCAAALLEKQGWEYVEAGELRRPTEGYLTEMDGVPASFFDVLFSELS